MAYKIYNTNNIDRFKQHSYWNDCVCEVFTQMQCDKLGQGREFTGQLELIDMNSIEISVVECEAAKVSHSQNHVSKSNDDIFLMHIQLDGVSLNQQSGYAEVLSAGDFALCKSTMPYSLTFEQPIRMMVIKIPRSILQQHIPYPDKLVGLKVDHSSGGSRILITYLIELWKNREAFSGLEHQASMSQIVLSLLSTTYDLAFPNTVKISQSSVRYSHSLRLKTYINKNLTNPDLTPSNIAIANNISTRYLRMLFSDGEVTCSKYILQQRINAVTKDLSNPATSGLKIGEIAYRWGFNNVSHFSKTFKDFHKVSPKEFRNSLIKRSLILLN